MKLFREADPSFTQALEVEVKERIFYPMLGIWENNKRFFCFYIRYTYILLKSHPSSFLHVSCFYFFDNCLWRIILGFQQSNWMPSMATIGSEYIIIFVIPTFFRAFLNFGGKTCQNSGRNICWLKGKNADRQSYCARALWISWPMGCRWGPVSTQHEAMT